MEAVIGGAAATTLFVVAAGNDATNNESVAQYPCNYTSTNLVCVAATTRTDGLASFSNHGTTSVDLGAPGTEIMSTWPAYQSRFTDGFESVTGWASQGSPATRTTRTTGSGLPGRSRWRVVWAATSSTR
jgi:hypothetical protein